MCHIEGVSHCLDHTQAGILVPVFELADEDPANTCPVVQFLMCPPPACTEVVNREAKAFSKILLHTTALRVYDGLQHCLSATNEHCFEVNG